MSKETKKKGTKKPYQKPEIVYEDFSLSTNIAAGCETIITNATKDACAYQTNYAGKITNIFTADIPAVCTTTEVDGNNGLCYHVPLENNDLFNS